MAHFINEKYSSTDIKVKAPSMDIVFKCLWYSHSNYRPLTVSYGRTLFLHFAHLMPMQYLNFFQTPTEVPAIREGYVYSRHAKHTLCHLKNFCQCLFYSHYVYLHRPCMTMFPALGFLAVVLLLVGVVVALGTT